MSLQPLDPQYADGIFNELTTLEVQLDADPLAYGPKRLNGKIALARKMTARCERMFLDVSQRLSTYKRKLRSAETIFDLSKKHLLANDPEVRAGRAVSERDAIATGKLKTELQAVHTATHAVEDLEAVLVVVKAKRGDLRDVQGRLRDQIRLCQEEIGLGGRWGSKSPRGTELEPGQGFADGADVEDVEKLIQDVRAVSDAETHLPAEVDDIDPEEEIEDDLAGAADDPDPALDGSDDDEPEEPDTIPGEELVDEFGFVPHCAACGEVQFKSPGGMTCSNGHGGADSVDPDDAPEEPEIEIEIELEESSEEVPAAADVLPATSGKDEVAAFLAEDDDANASGGKGLSRREVEEADEVLDIDDILANFDG
jgi:hypothetical protein